MAAFYGRVWEVLRNFGKVWEKISLPPFSAFARLRCTAAWRAGSSVCGRLIPPSVVGWLYAGCCLPVKSVKWLLAGIARLPKPLKPSQIFSIYRAADRCSPCDSIPYAILAVCSGGRIKTTGLAGGMHHAFKAMVPAARHEL